MRYNTNHGIFQLHDLFEKNHLKLFINKSNQTSFTYEADLLAFIHFSVLKLKQS